MMRKAERLFAMALIASTLTLAQNAAAVTATGGNTTTTNSGYRIHTFTTVGTTSLAVTAGGNVEVLVVAGGGGGGGDYGGGGGAGGLIYSNGFLATTGSIQVTVGAGGGGGLGAYGTNGNDSVFSNLVANGGGGGASGTGPGNGGGCGGGGTDSKAGGLGTGVQGKEGGVGGGASNYGGGGGGGAGSIGTNGTGSAGGKGGAGASNAISGAWVTYAGGGGGGTYSAGTAGTGGAGGGGDGGAGTANNPGLPGTNGLGGGGGGGGFKTASAPGGNGGSGIVIVRYSLVPVIENRSATNVTAASAWLNGYIVSAGGAPITVAVYWGATDGGAPSSGLWTATNTLSGGPWTDGDSVTYEATGLTANVTYYYRYYATNSFSNGWAASSEYFLASDVTVTNTDPVATRTPSGTPDTGTLTIRRDPAATNDALTVSYAWGGTAVQGADYTPSPAGTNITLAAGVSSTNITITPLWAYPQGTKTVWLTLLPGAYAIGSPASNEVAIKDYVYTPGANVTTNAGDWNGAIWSLGRRPLLGDDVTVKHAVTLSNATDYLGSFTITNATLTFTNWNTTLSATNVVLNSAGYLTHAGPTTTTSNNVYIICTNLTIDAGASINVNSKGYKGGIKIATPSYGPGGGGWVSGGGYGGVGGTYPSYVGGGTYGSLTAPTHLGSGGGGEGSYDGGHGGGAVRVDAANAVLVNGAITANGTDITGSGGGGSGGSIWINCRTLNGTNGLVSAGGGNGGYCGGGGGRISVIYDPTAQAQLAVPGIVFSAIGGNGNANNVYTYALGLIFSDVGTLYFPDSRFLTQPIQHSGQWLASNFTGLAVSSLTVTSAWIRFGAGTQITVTNGVTVTGTNSLGVRNRLELKDATLTCGGNVGVTNASIFMLGRSVLSSGGDITATNSSVYMVAPATTGSTVNCGGNLNLLYGSSLSVKSGLTNAAMTNYGALVSVTGDVQLVSNAVIYSYAYLVGNLYGYAPLFRARNFTVASGAAVNANATGWSGGNTGSGPGRGGYFCGGSYGGRGGTYNVSYVSGPTYGSSNAPILPGSGGSGDAGGSRGGNGGGVIWIEVTDTIGAGGLLTANGGNGTGAGWGSGGSGGSINLICYRFVGSGSVSADGGNVYTGGGATGGGGGRIRIARIPAPTFSGTFSVTGGVGAVGTYGTNGTLVLQDLPFGRGMILRIR